MNTLHILGNGFDLNIGLKTSYKDFYDFYINEASHDSKTITKLKESISSDIDKWSDLELALGNYTKNVVSREELSEILTSIIDSMCNFLLNAERRSPSISTINAKKMYQELQSPEIFLKPAEVRDFVSWSNSFKKSENHKINIATFNYTSTFNRLFFDSNRKEFKNGYEKFGSIVNIHGEIEDFPLIGLNDDSQITNKSLKDDSSIHRLILKTTQNKLLRLDRDTKFQDLISSANLICIFGSSIGESDKTWWECIGSRILEGQTKLIIFNYSNKEISSRLAHLSIEQSEEVINRFLRISGINEKTPLRFRHNIYVATNTEFLKPHRMQLNLNKSA